MSKELTVGIDGKGKKLQSRIWFFSLVDEENDIPTILENLMSCTACQVFTILHDKDFIRQDDGTLVKKRNHHHFCIRYENPTQLSTIANVFGLDVRDWHLIQRCKNFKSSCRYLLHLDQKDKHIYDISEIKVLRGTKDDYFNIAIGKAQVVTTDADLFPDFGDFDKKPYKLQYTEIYEHVSDPKRRNALIRELKICWDNYLTKRKYDMEKKNVKVLFVEGKPGTGKSTFAQNLAISNHKSWCISSSSNDIMQDYTCEDYLILDDLRDTSFSFEDLLKLLDNYVISTVKSRYNNKLFLGEYIIITSAKPLNEWYLNTSEDRTQLFRRISLYARCRKTDSGSMLSDLYIPSPNERAINDNGFPNGTPITQPILILNESIVKSVEDCWKELGIDVDVLRGETKPTAIQLSMPINDDDLPF